MLRPGSTEEDKVRGYVATVFGGKFPNYECVYCQFSTIFLPKMILHMAEDDHPWAYPVPVVELPAGELVTEPKY